MRSPHVRSKIDWPAREIQLSHTPFPLTTILEFRNRIPTHLSTCFVPASDFLDLMLSRRSRVFWDVMPCSLVEVYRYFRGTLCLLLAGCYPDLFFDSDYRGSAFLRCQWISIRLHCVTSQRTVFFNWDMSLPSSDYCGNLTLWRGNDWHCNPQCRLPFLWN
jgi:hypothetical protein